MKTETIKLIVKPNSTATGVYGIYMNRIKIKLAAVPEKGKANKELIKIIAGEKSIYKEISIKSDKDLNLTSRLLSS
ncbi:MAG: DUF167 domain-containing protein [Actinobacteria bacterium]|nr:DUF167 domain-containing protein [Actinomycetota bacterium]